VRVVLISPYPDITAFGLRVLGAVLKARGHAVRMVFMPAFEAEERPTATPYAEAALDGLAGLCADAGAVCIGLMTNYFDHAVQMTARLRRAGDTPIVWGGIHPTIRPLECLEHADFVCVGEGEESLAGLLDALAAGRDPGTVPGIWSRKDGAVRDTGPGPLQRDLDRLPAPDYGPQGHFVLDGERPEPMTPARLERFLARGSVSALYGMIGYQTMVGRGCPHRCTYCGNDALRRIYAGLDDGPGGVRWRSAGHVYDELERAVAAMPFIEFIWFSDDALLSMKTAALREFFAGYRRRIGLPFACLTSPLTLSREKLDILIEAGLFSIQMGVQTGSARIQTLYNRAAMTNARILEAMDLIHRHRDVLRPPLYDFIIDASFETAEDRRQTLQLIARMPQPYRLQPFSLVLYPGTRLHDMAASEGTITDETEDIYRKSYTARRPGYHTLLLLLARNGRFPGWLMRVMASRPVCALLGGAALQPVYERLFRFGRTRRAA
jgi:radical SAM superfamily enzyme YgiQ (UPF0313 family)